MARSGDGRLREAVRLAVRLARRLWVCSAWLVSVMSARAAGAAVIIIALEFAGRFLQTAGFVFATKIVLHVFVSPDPAWTPYIDPEDPAAFTTAAFIVAFLIVFASGLLFLADRRAIAASTDFETERYAAALELIGSVKGEGRRIAPGLETEILFQSPRYMGRMLLALLRGVPAATIAATALAISLWLTFSLTALLILSMVALAPFFILFMMQSSRTSRRMKEAAEGFNVAKKAIGANLVEGENQTAAYWTAEIKKHDDYAAFLNAYRARLSVAPYTQLLGALSLAVALVVIFLWFLTAQDATATSLMKVLISLLLLRLFMQNINIVMGSLSAAGTFYPYFSNYITLAHGETPSYTHSGGGLGDEEMEMV